MDREKIQSFIRSAESDLASVRSSLLIAGQTGDGADIRLPRRNLARLKQDAIDIEQIDIAQLIAESENSLDQLADGKGLSSEAAYRALDLVAKIEAAVWEIPMKAEDFLLDVSGFVDSSFDDLMTVAFEAAEHELEEFEIDEETLDIFRSEADELLVNITDSLVILASSPGDQAALWDIRRSAHTFKGAAGIVGLKDASEIAHMMEDLLDKLVELRREPAAEVIDFLVVSTERLKAIVAAKIIEDDGKILEKSYENALSRIESWTGPDHGQSSKAVGDHVRSVRGQADQVQTRTTPIVRVSLDRLDELIKVSRSLIINRSAIAERFDVFSRKTDDNAEALTLLQSLFDTQKRLTDEMQAKLLRIRMVRFGTLETRLNRAVHATCLDENKKAIVELENGDIEIDTQIIDALVEPLLHLLKNAVVHGIEAPETRRLIGKPERGTIRISLEADDEALVLSVSDDGGGISVPRLKEKAISCGLIDAEKAAAMTDHDAVRLVFDRGLTTAGKIDLNAGRGVGMSIVKESVESRGGTVTIETEPQRGTKFNIFMPLFVSKGEKKPTSSDEAESSLETSESLSPLVLIVDDSASIRRQSTLLVEKAGCRVITAGNGAEALELLLSGDWVPDLILSDVEMPQIDGWEFLEYVKTDDNFGHVPVVMVTSLDADGHRGRASELGASHYIVKPLSDSSFQRVLETVGLTVSI